MSDAPTTLGAGAGDGAGDADRFRRCAQIFDVAIGKPEGERAAHVRDACGDDEALIGEVMRLLEAAGGPDPLEALARHASGGAALRAGGSLEVGTRVGPYLIERLLGAGGFGEVYLAHQREPIDRRVALKLIRPGMGSGQVLARFELERQTLALMDHPGIARVFDAGLTDDGRPFVAMEHIDGDQIDRYCDRVRMPVPERVRLLVRVARALHHAHQRGVIHRDIKPSNVLVAEVDGKPEPRIIDFGIAKATADSGLETGGHTGEGNLLGTPAYMAPEQADGGPVDTRTDLYSLAVLGYRLLAGVTPLDFDTRTPMPVREVLETIRSTDPPRPSVRVAGLGDSAGDIAGDRGTDATRLRSRLRGDLDWVLMRALAKYPGERYDAVSAFADDLERYLRREPVQAGPPSAVYRFRKLAQRNKAAFVATVLVTISVVLGLIGTSIGFVRAERALEREREQVRITQAINDFFNDDVLAAADPWEDPDPDTSVLVALERAVERVGDRFVGEPLIEASIRRVAGRILANLGDYEGAERELERAIELFGDATGERSGETAWTRALLASLHQDTGRYETARAMLEAALVDIEAQYGPESSELQDQTNNLVIALSDLGLYDEGLELSDRQMERVATGAIASEALAVTVLGNHATLLYKSGDFAGAIETYREMVELSERVNGPDHPETGTGVGALALIYQRTGELELSAQMHARSIASSERSLGRDHPYTLTLRNNYALLLSGTGEYERADDVFQEILRIRLEVLGERHSDTMVSMLTTARNLGKLERYEEAIALGERGRALFAAELGPDHPYTAIAEDILATVRGAAGGEAGEDAVPGG
ncbi:MAG: serine/threonine-protein kinase [Planctomycetota bacterium]